MEILDRITVLQREFELIKQEESSPLINRLQPSGGRYRHHNNDCVCPNPFACNCRHNEIDRQPNGFIGERLVSSVDIQDGLSAAGRRHGSVSSLNASGGIADFGESTMADVRSSQSNVCDSTTQCDAPVLPRQVEQDLVNNVTILDVLRMWDEGAYTLPPITTWNDEQLQRHERAIGKWRILIKYFNETFDNNLSEITKQFSQPDGRLFTVKEVLESIGMSSHDCQPSDVSDEQSLCSETPVGVHTMSDPQSISTQAVPQEEHGGPSTSANYDEQQARHSLAPCVSVTSGSETSTMYTLPSHIDGRSITPLDVIAMWDNGYGDVPPINLWNAEQKANQQSKIAQWRKIVSIFKDECNSSILEFKSRFSTKSGTLLSVPGCIVEHERTPAAVNAQQRVTACKRPVPILPCPVSGQGVKKLPLWPVPSRNMNAMLKVKRRKTTAGSMELSNNRNILTVSASRHDVSQMQTGMATSESSNQSSLALIYSMPCNSTSGGQHLQSIKIEDAVSLAGQSGSPQPMAGSSTVYILPYTLPSTDRVVDIVQHWELGTDEFPAIRSWSSEERQSYGDVLLTWERVARVFTDVFHSDHKRFTSECSKETPQSLIDKYINQVEENASIIPANNVENGIGRMERNLHPRQGQSNEEAPPVADSVKSEGKQAVDDAAPPYVLPRKINGVKLSALNVINLWYHGFNGMAPVGKWNVQQRSRQQSKISRWRRLVEIFETRSNGDIKTFREMFSGPNGKLLPIMSILAKNDDSYRYT